MRGWRSAVLAALLLAAVWQLVVWTTGVQHFILPSPGQVLAAMWGNRVLIGEHAWVTLLEVLIGLAIGSALGIATAIHLSVSAAAQALLRPLLVFSQAIPVFALAPILTLWLGYGLWSKIAMAVLIIYFPVTSAFFDGLMRTPRGFMDLAQTMGARPAAIMFRIRIPAALPALGTGLKLAAVYAPIGAVIGEWVGASRGLGYLMLLANGRAKIDLMFAAMLVLGVLSVGLYLAADFLTRRAFFGGRIRRGVPPTRARLRLGGIPGARGTALARSGPSDESHGDLPLCGVPSRFVAPGSPGPSSARCERQRSERRSRSMSHRCTSHLRQPWDRGRPVLDCGGKMPSIPSTFRDGKHAASRMGRTPLSHE